MVKKNSTITIAIPALNEYPSLKLLIPYLLNQKFYKATLKEIVILSDGSTDKTNQISKEIKDDRLKILSTKKRQGKAFQINKIFKLSKTDHIILLDADINLKSHRTLFNLSKDAYSHQKCLVSGVVVPQAPKNIVQKVAYSGVSLWDKIRSSGDHSEMYLCEGSIRSFPKSLYKKLIFPHTSADEAFSYIESQRLGFGFRSCSGAVAKYTLPKTWRDFYHQQRRYANSQSIQNQNFSSNLVDKYYTIKTKNKITSLLKEFLLNPAYLSLYTLFIIFIKITTTVKPAKFSSLWKVLKSTK